MSDAGTYIWQGLKPCFKMLFTIMCGFVLTKKGLFPPPASKGLSQLVMNIGLPCLIFSSMVPSFNSSNISNFGPLAMIGILYQFFGLLMVLLIRELFYVPKTFYWGILVLGTFSNWGNLPTAIVSSVGAETPFNPSTDPQLGLAYVSVLIFVMNITFWGTGAYKVCKLDFKDNTPDIPRTLSGRMKRSQVQFTRLYARLRGHTPPLKSLEGASEEKPMEGHETLPVSRVNLPGTVEIYRSPSPEIVVQEGSSPQADPEKAFNLQPLERMSAIPEVQPHTNIFRSVYDSIMAILTPPTIAILVSLPFSLVGPLKALLVETPGWSGSRIPLAPDGKPPLSFFYDFTVFFAGLVIPGTLVILGASFARIKISRRRFKEMPLGSIFATTIAKMVLMPVIGIALVLGLRDHTTLFPKEQKMLSFVGFLLSGTPSAVNQLIVTSMYAKGENDLETLSSFLVVQYAFLLFQSAALTAISLYLVA